MEIVLKYFSEFTPEQLSQIQALKGLYEEWNSRINVISRKDIEGLYEKHVLHSLSIAAAFDFENGKEIIDIGTGGGFPGIPLAIYFPKVKFHLVDSIGKKLKVVDSVVDNLKLQNVTTQHVRAEEIKNRKFDFVVSRAVAPLKELWNWSRPLLKKHTKNAPDDKADNQHMPGLICLKGGDLNEEIRESGTRPRIIELSELFEEAYFDQKYLLYITR